MIHYHGTPITPADKMLTLAGRHFCVSYADPRAVRVAHEIGQSVMLDNGAFTFWQGGATPDWDGFMDWAEPWLDYPTTWAVIPDVIDGDEDANDKLLVKWFARAMPHDKSAPVWHLHESLDRLRRLAYGYEKVCFGSSGAYRTPGSAQWCQRVDEAFNVVADDRGRVPWVHMLRGMAMAGRHWPFASVDSTNATRNHAGSAERDARPVAEMVAEMDSRQCPARWHRKAIPNPLFDPHIDYPERFSETGVI